MPKDNAQQSWKDLDISVRTLVYISLFWGLLVFGFLVWQAYEYRGIYEVISEWQFRNWDKTFPLGTILVLTGLLELPLIVLIVSRLRARRKKYGKIQPYGAINREQISMRILGVLAVVSFVISLALLAVGLLIGGVGEKAATSLTASQKPETEGMMVRLKGVMRTDKIGFYSENMIVTQRDLWVAPVTSGERRGQIRYFAEITPMNDPAQPQSVVVTGILRHAAMPGGLRRLYEYEGFNVADDAYVVFKSVKSARWPFFSASARMAIWGVLLALAALVLGMHARRINKRLDQVPGTA